MVPRHACSLTHPELDFLETLQHLLLVEGAQLLVVDDGEGVLAHADAPQQLLGVDVPRLDALNLLRGGAGRSALCEAPRRAHAPGRREAPGRARTPEGPGNPHPPLQVRKHGGLALDAREERLQHDLREDDPSCAVKVNTHGREEDDEQRKRRRAAAAAAAASDLQRRLDEQGLLERL